MRTVYLIRHGEPDFPGGVRLCLSATDLPLSRVGRMQGVLLRAFFADRPVTAVFHSGLARTAETARFLSPRARCAEGWQELGVGLWEGLSFPEIRRRFPEEYERRGRDPFRCPMPGGEPPEACMHRALNALSRLLAETEGDIAVVAHAGLNRLLLTALARLPREDFLSLPQPYGCVNTIRCTDDGGCAVEQIGRQPRPTLTPALCAALHQAAGTPEKVRRHGQAVAEQARDLAAELEGAGVGPKLDREGLYAAALLHDLARGERNHAAVGAAWLRGLGYPEVAAWVACHHDLKPEQERVLSEALLLYLADKLVDGAERVPLSQRFARSEGKCRTPESRLAHERRKAQALRVERFLREMIEERWDETRKTRG